MTQFLICAVLITWFVFQFQPKGQARWKARHARLTPLGRYLRADVEALRKALRSPRRPAGRFRAPNYLPDDFEA